MFSSRGICSVILLVLLVGVCIYSGYSVVKNVEKVIKESRESMRKYKEMERKVSEYEKISKYYKRIDVRVSFYTLSRDECDSDYKIGALGRKMVVGRDVAVSRDLSWLLGKWVYIKGIGRRYVNDLMNKRYKMSVDVLVGSKKEARKGGVFKSYLVVLFSV